MSVTLITLFGLGDRMASIVTVTGPTSYTQVTAGTPPAGPTGGQSIPASAFGLKFINKVESSLDNSGKYDVIATSGPGASTAVTLDWIVARTGAEETGGTDLHTFSVKLMAIGR